MFLASEYQYFLLFYGLPCLSSVLPSYYFDHFKKLVEACFLLNKDAIQQDDLERSEKLLSDFHKEFMTLYG